MDIAGVIIAVLALGLTVWQGWVTRKHNRLSVTPLLDSRIDTNRTNEGVTFKFIVRNAGIGPAIIKRRDFYFEGQPFKPKGDQLLEEIVERCFSGKFKYRLTHHSLPGIGTAILPGQEISGSPKKMDTFP